MIEFTINRNRSGKKSRWAKKYPRKRILKRGSEKAAGWYFHNWLDGGYHHFHGDLHKFLLKNVGRPVDKVFSEFLQRCRKGTEKYNLKELFYDMFEEKEDIDYRGGFYLSNGIINYKKRSKRAKETHKKLQFQQQSIVSCAQVVRRMSWRHLGDLSQRYILLDLYLLSLILVICSKVRDPKTGQLSGFKIENPEVIEKNVNLPFVVIDDLCDGGGTFKGIAQLLGFHYPVST